MKVGKKITLYLMTAFFTAAFFSAGVLSGTNKVYGRKITSAAQAEEKALQKVKNATVSDVDKDYEDGSAVYDVELVKGSKKYEITYRASDGKMTSYGWEKRNTDPARNKALIGRNKCRKLALKRVKNGNIVRIDLKVDDGIDIYKVKLKAGNKKYTLKYHARTGVLTEYEWELLKPSGENADGYIGLKKAQKTALAKVPGATIVKTEFDSEDGIPVYEVELVKGDYEYELKIDARTGEILEQEKDWND